MRSNYAIARTARSPRAISRVSAGTTPSGRTRRPLREYISSRRTASGLFADASADPGFSPIQTCLLTARDESAVAARRAPLSHPCAPIGLMQSGRLCSCQLTIAHLLVNALVLPCETIVDLLTPRMTRLPSSVRMRRCDGDDRQGGR